MKCPECDGRGGGMDYWGEWDDCPCCNGAGSVTPERLAAYRADVKAVDDWIEKLNAAKDWSNPPPHPFASR